MTFLARIGAASQFIRTRTNAALIEAAEKANVNDTKIDYARAFVNAGILAGLGFFTTLGGLGASGLMKDWRLGLLAAGIAAGLSFFTRLAFEFGAAPQK